MSENEIKPVAWRYSDLDGEVSFTDDERWANWYPETHAPLYDQSAIDRLTAERDAAVAELARLRAEVVAAHTGENIDGCGMTDAKVAAIDAARSERQP